MRVCLSGNVWIDMKGNQIRIDPDTGGSSSVLLTFSDEGLIVDQYALQGDEELLGTCCIDVDQLLEMTW